MKIGIALFITAVMFLALAYTMSTPLLIVIAGILAIVGSVILSAEKQ